LIILGAAIVVGMVAVERLVVPATPKSGRSLAFVGFVPLPKPTGDKIFSVLDYLSVDGAHLYVSSVTSGAVYKVPLGDGPLPDAAAVEVASGAGAAHGVVIDPASKLAFVSRSGTNVVDVVDPARMTTIKHIAVDDDVDGIFFDPANKLIYAVSGDPHSASLIDPATQSKVGKIALGGKPEFAVYDPVTKLIYQNLADKGQIALVDTAKRAVVGNWSLGPCREPTGAAIDVPGRRLFVVCGGNSLLVVVSLEDHRIVAALPIGADPDSVAYDASLKRVYSIGRSGVLFVTRQDGPNRYSVVDSIKLHFAAHTLAIDPASHRVYAAYASLFLPPRLAVFAAKP